MTDNLIAQSLRARRARCGASRTALAQAAGVSLPTIVNLEGGLIPRRGTSLQRVEAALDELERERVRRLLDELQRLGVDVAPRGPREVPAA